jgi:hypothetical protein
VEYANRVLNKQKENLENNEGVGEKELSQGKPNKRGSWA